MGYKDRDKLREYAKQWEKKKRDAERDARGGDKWRAKFLLRYPNAASLKGKELTEEEVLILSLFFFEGWSVGAIAKKLGVSRQWCNTLKTQAQKKLEIDL